MRDTELDAPPLSDPRSTAGPWTPSRPPGRGARRALYVGGTLILLAAAGSLAGLSVFRRNALARERRARTDAVAAGPVVRVARVSRAPGSRTLVLTGETRPFLSVALYAKVSGYLEAVRVDKGDRVTAGQVLAVVESPETDQQAAGALADARNKREIADRDRQLIAKKLIAPEEASQAETDARVAAATAERYQALEGYERIRAPFAGTVTARYADPGALVQSAEGSRGALPIVEIGTTDSLRTFVYVDQRDAADIRKGAPATITDPNRPDVRVTGTVTRLTGQLDPSTRTLLAEIDLGNRRGAIVPGSFVQVALALAGHPYLEIPAEALIVRGAARYVAVVGPNDRVAFREVHVADTDGVTVRLTDGVQEGDQVALNLGDSVPEGQHVRPASDTTLHRSL